MLRIAVPSHPKTTLAIFFLKSTLFFLSESRGSCVQEEPPDRKVVRGARERHCERVDLLAPRWPRVALRAGEHAPLPSHSCRNALPSPPSSDATVLASKSVRYVTAAGPPSPRLSPPSAPSSSSSYIAGGTPALPHTAAVVVV